MDYFFQVRGFGEGYDERYNSSCVSERTGVSMISCSIELHSCGGLGGYINTAAPQRQSWAPDRTGSAHKVWVEKHNYDCNVIVEMPANASVYLLQVWVPHFSLLGCFLQCSFHKPPSASLQDNKQVKFSFPFCSIKAVRLLRLLNSIQVNQRTFARVSA